MSHTNDEKRAPRSRRRWTWQVLAWTVLIGGVALSVSGGLWWGSVVRDQERDAFDVDAGNVIDSIHTELRRNMDLTATAQTLLALQPEQTNAEIKAWFTSTGASQRFPEALGFQYLERVDAAGLDAYAATAAADPVPMALPFDASLIQPPGARAQYCFARLGVVHVSGTDLQQTPPGWLDYCATGLAAALTAATDSGQIVVIPASMYSNALVTALGPLLKQVNYDAATQELVKRFERSVFVFAPVYQGGVVPATVDGRRQSVLGWVNGVFDIERVVENAVGHSSMMVSLDRWEPTMPPVTVTAVDTGLSVPYTAARTFDADGVWTVTVRGSARVAGFAPGIQSLAVIAVGSLVSLLLFAFFRISTTSRNRALELVDRRTGELRHQALHDALTGLPNRVLVLDRTQQLVARAQQQGTAVAVLFVDLDNFKDINDTLGHAAGDMLLQAVAGRFSAALRHTETVARIGGDEFVVVADAPEQWGGPGLIAQRLLDVMNEPFQLGDRAGVTYRVTASIGVAEGDGSAEDLLRDADIALYEAKDRGRNCFVVFEGSMQQAVESRLDLETDLRSALDEDEFFLVFQPTFGIRDVATTGVEALLRWQHPRRGIVAPNEFIPLLEGNGLIVPVGRWVLHEACRQGARWHAAGHAIAMSVNVSARQLESDTLLVDVAEALAMSGFDPNFLSIEITESTLMRDANATVERLHALKRLGVRVAIDDFGTGYSSLAYLRRFPVDILKIDRSFIATMTDSGESAALVHTLVQLGKTLGLETIAEGIEHEEQLDRLQIEDCDTGQGFLFSQPLEAHDLEALLGIPSLNGASRTGRRSSP